jgi:broad specificity phosphatase PhoE
MNVYTAIHDVRKSDFVDPILIDARLIEEGRLEAEKVRTDIIKEHGKDFFNKFSIVYSSPLTRAIETANIISKDLLPSSCQRRITPLLTERIYSSADVGRSKSEIISEPESEGWDFSLVEDEEWWYQYNEARDGAYKDFRKGSFQHHAEMKHVFAERLQKLKEFLLSHEEEHILLIGHRLVFYGLTGKKFNNIEMVTINVEDLPNQFFIDY